MDEDELAEVGLTVSASERKKMAKSGAAMPGGHFPIHDLDHLASAKAFYHQGKYADQDPAEIHAHINRRAKALGGTGLDDDDGDEDIRESEHQGNEGPKPRPGKRRTRPVQVRTRGQSPFGSEGGSPDGGTGPSGVAASGKRMLVRAGYGYETIALSEDEEWAEAEIMRLAAKHPTVGLAGMRDPRNYGTVMVDGQGVTPNVSRHFDFDIHDVGARDDGDPSDPEGADTASVIARLQANHPEFFTEKPYGANRRGRLAGPYPGTGPSGKPQTAGR